ncbi:calcium channel flower homolog [Clavelina lepadiformis]|uniref:Calcium channel flower n=1 Tax=Clavelina lepadiformis TaxID=159417 RepID=A0ABP0F1S1_CLALP
MPSQDIENQVQKGDGATWWCKLLAKAVGVIAAIVCLIFAISNFITFHITCLAAGIIMVFISAILILFEAPICCMFFERTKSISDWLDRRKYWHKGLFYIIISIIPVILCPGFSTFIGCICPFATGVIYGLMSLGKKADRGEMLTNAEGNNFTKFENQGD